MDTYPEKTFPEKLKSHRKRLGLTQSGLASFLSVSPRAIWQWEQGSLPSALAQEGAMTRLVNANFGSGGLPPSGDTLENTRSGATS